MTRDEAKAELLLVVTECVPAEHHSRVSRAVAAYVAACVRQEITSRKLVQSVGNLARMVEDFARKAKSPAEGSR